MRLEDLLVERGIPMAPTGHHHRRAGWLQMDCPHCGVGSRRWHLGFCTRTRHFACWQCGPLLSKKTLATLLGIKFDEAALLYDGLEGHVTPQEERRCGTLRPPPGLMPLTHPNAAGHRHYLGKRGFDTPELQRLWGLEAIGLLGGRWRWRVYIPILLYGEVVSFTTRSIADEGVVRYQSASPGEEAIAHADLLYGEDYCRHAIAVVEGPADVWAVGPGAAATLGTGFNGAQVARIARYPVRILCFDNTPTAQRMARALARDLAPLRGRTYNVTLDSKDAGCSTLEERAVIRNLLENG